MSHFVQEINSSTRIQVSIPITFGPCLISMRRNIWSTSISLMLEKINYGINLVMMTIYRKMYDIKFNIDKNCTSRTFYMKILLIASRNVFLRVDFLWSKVLFFLNVQLGFKVCPIFLIVKIVFLLSKMQVKLIDK